MYIHEMLWPLIVPIGGFESTRMLKLFFMVSLALAILRKKKELYLFSQGIHM